MLAQKIFVSGCFDLLHSGHIAFLKEASSYGQLYVGIGSDKTIFQLKGRPTINTEEERKYMIESLSCVYQCTINSGNGFLDFENDLKEIQPDIFIVNEDGHSVQKEKLCKESGIEYKILQRKPFADLPPRSTSSLRTLSKIPFRIDLAGGWLDQPFVSQYFPGPVLTISIEPGIEFNLRSGMASSTRNIAMELWQTAIPVGDPEKHARLLFRNENPPGKKEIAGSQDALGIVMPGLNHLYYNNNYWPEKITSVHDEDILNWLESHLYLLTLGPRENDYSVLDNQHISKEGAEQLSVAAENCWKAILAKDKIGFGKSFTDSFNAQVAMFPNMADEPIYGLIEKYKNEVLGYKLSGAGGGGYLILFSDKPVKDTLQIKIRRKDWL